MATAIRQATQLKIDFIYTHLNNHITIPPESVNLLRSNSRTRKKHRDVLQRQYGKDKCSPYWKGTICRTIPDWNSLDRPIAEADSPLIFKSQLSSLAP